MSMYAYLEQFYLWNCLFFVNFGDGNWRQA